MTEIFARGAGQGRAGRRGRRPLRRGYKKCDGAGRCGHRPLRKRILRCVGEGLCPSHGRGNRRSAAGGRGSEPVSRKCPDWRPQQWPGIGWHDGGQENPAPTNTIQGVQRATARVAPTGWCALYAADVKTGRHRRGCLPGGRLILYASIPRLVRYFFTIRATLKVIASSNSRRSRPVSFLIFSRR